MAERGYYSDKLFEQMSVTMGKYHRNITQISKEDREGKYKNALKNLKLRLKHEVNEYILAAIWETIVLPEDKAIEFCVKWRSIYDERKMSEKFEKAAFELYNPETVRMYALTFAHEIEEDAERVWRDLMNTQH